MPLACGPCQRTTQTRPLAPLAWQACSSSPDWNAFCSASCVSKMRAGASITWRSSGTAATLITLRPRLPVSSFRPPVRLNGSEAGRTTDASREAPIGVHCRPRSNVGSRVYSRRPPSRTVSTSSCISPASSSSRMTKPGPPAAWNWFTSACPLGYTRASSGTTDESSAKSSQSIVMPAERATATQWIRWLVDPPVASSAAIALTMQRSSTCRPMGVKRRALTLPSSVRTDSRVSSSRSSLPGLMKAAPGTCRPIASISIWLLLAVP